MRSSSLLKIHVRDVAVSKRLLPAPRAPVYLAGLDRLPLAVAFMATGHRRCASCTPCPAQAPRGARRAWRGGFSMIELLIVLVIVGVLASVAYPSYAAYAVRARRLEGKIALFEAMQKEESLYTRTNRYAAFSADQGEGNGSPFQWWSGSSAATSAYELQARACAGSDLAQCVEIVATPGTRRVDWRFRDPDCGELSLLSTGERRAATGAKACWP